MKIEVTVNLSDVFSTISAPGVKAKQFGSLREQVGLIAQADVDLRFESAPNVRQSGTVYGGAYWPALTEKYLKRNPRREGGQQLKDTGELLQSFAIGSMNNVLRTEGNTIVFGTSLPKARGLHKKRPLLGKHKALVEQVKRLCAKFLTE